MFVGFLTNYLYKKAMMGFTEMRLFEKEGNPSDSQVLSNTDT